MTVDGLANATAARPEGKHERPVGINFVPLVVTFIVAFLLYALLPTKNFNYADDSLRWAYELTQRGNIINSHHLFLNAMRFLYQSLTGMGFNVSPVRLLAFYSAFWGATGLAFLNLLLQRAGYGQVALWASMICGVFAGYWSYSIVGDVYSPSIALMVVGLFFSYQALVWRGDKFPWLNAVAATAAFALMLVHHQAMFFFVIGTAVGLVILRFGELRRRIQISALISGAVASAALVIYAFAYRQAEMWGFSKGFVKFCAGYVDSFDARPDQKRVGLGTLLNFLAGEARALVSTNVIFRDEKFALAVQSRYPTRAVYPYPFLVAGIPVWLAICVGIMAIAAAVIAILLVFRGIWTGFPERGLITLICVAALPQLVFFIWWEGISDEFCLWTLPLIAIAVGRGSAATKRPVTYLGILLATVATSTLIGSALPYWNANRDIDLVNDRFTSSLTSKDFLVGFEDIQPAARIRLASEHQGFGYYNLAEIAGHWTDRDQAKFDEVVNSALAKGAGIRVSPRLLNPPKSGIAFMRYLNPNFDSRRQAAIEKLRGIPGVEWLKFEVFLKDYFYSDSTASTADSSHR